MRTLARLLVMMFLALLIVACGDDDDGGDATEEATTASTVSTEAANETATAAADETEEAATGSTVGTPAMSASPAAAGAVPGMATPASAMGTPAAPPVAVASPVAAATPEDAMAAVPVPAGAGDATPAAEMVTLSGEVVLPGTVNEAFVIAEDGCVGLGEHADLRAGRQVVVRDETGTIVGVTELEASDATDACAWTFSLEVPQSPFYAVSIPMAVERVFTQAEVEASDGVIAVPLD